MSEVASATDVNHEASDGVLNGGLEKQPVTHVEGEEEESDDYDEEEEADYEEDRQIVGDEDDDQEQEEEEEGEENQGKDTLTHLLLGNPNAPVEGDEIDDEEDEEEEEDDDEYIEEAGDVAPTGGKKRSIDEVADEDDSQGSKKAKA